MPRIELDRRSMLGGAAVLAAAATTGACASGAGDEHWDHEADLVCVGSGAAASTAAVIAAAEGASVLVLEKMPILGGTSAKSSGVVWVFNNFILREQGIDDKKGDALRYAVRYGFPTLYDSAHPTLGLDEARYRVLEAFYDNGSTMIDRLRELKVLEFNQFRLFTVNRPSPDYGDHLPENKVPTGRCLAVSSGHSGGMVLTGKLASYLKSKNVPIMLNTRVTDLIQDAQGRVVGVVADQAGKPIRVRAKKGVVFGTGGYSHNVELCNRHQAFFDGTCSLPGSTGDFIPIAQQAGAMMGNLNHAWHSQVVLGEALANRGVGWGVFLLPGDSMILVDRNGRRVVNEKRDYNDRARVHYVYDANEGNYPNRVLFMLFDRRSLDAFGGAFPFPAEAGGQPYLLQGATWSELTANIDAQLAKWSSKIAGARLAKDFALNVEGTVQRFNGYARAGQDPEFQRGHYLYDREWHLFFSARRKGTSYPENPYPSSVMHPFTETGPYYCIILGPGTLDTAGGPQVDHNAQVLGSNGEPMPGLYAAGNCIAAPTGEGYLGAGGTIGPAMTFGYIAAKHALSNHA